MLLIHLPSDFHCTYVRLLDPPPSPPPLCIPLSLIHPKLTSLPTSPTLSAMSFIRSGACRRRGESEYGQWPLELWISSSSASSLSATQPPDFIASTCNVWTSKSAACGLPDPREPRRGHPFHKRHRLVEPTFAKLSRIERNDLLIAPTAGRSRFPVPHMRRAAEKRGPRSVRPSVRVRQRTCLPERRLAARMPGRRRWGRARADTCRGRPLRCIHTHLDTYLAGRVPSRTCQCVLE